MTYAIHPFYFPTTVAFVDDSADFLANLSLQLDSRLAFRLFGSPFDALVHLNGSALGDSQIRSYFGPYRQREDDDLTRLVIDISLDLIHREVHNELRFDQTTVVVVDFDMPDMNGLEFCRNIKNPLVKKILLTGKADERLAVKAFNEGLIDRFIRKQDPAIMDELNSAINETQSSYFAELQRMLSDVLVVGSPRFLRDKRFAEHFGQLRRDLGIVEYYLTCLPDGMLMVDAQGTPYLLIVRCEEHLLADHDIAEDQAAPEELLEILRRGQAIPYFWKTQGFYSPLYKDWRACLHPAVEFRGDEWYLYTVVKNPAGFNLRHVLSYADYLDRLDEEGQRALPVGT